MSMTMRAVRAMKGGNGFTRRSSGRYVRAMSVRDAMTERVLTIAPGPQPP